MQDHVPNAVGHFDIAGPDAHALHDFYAGVFGWGIDEKGPGYALVETPEGTPRGAIVEAQDAALTIGVVVPDIEAALAASIRHGGDVAMPTVDNGWVRKAILVDPAGNRVTVIQR
jgi:predicted enzyme related to lactoylglutathione lyase